jgi:hypothetical protein
VCIAKDKMIKKVKRKEEKRNIEIHKDNNPTATAIIKENNKQEILDFKLYHGAIVVNTA